MNAADAGRPVVAHCATPFLWDGGGSWIHNQIAWLQRWYPVVLTQEARNLDQYPVPEIHSAEDLPALKRLANRAVRRWTGEYPFYAGLLRRRGARLVHAHFGYQGCRCRRAAAGAGLPLVTTFYGADATSYPRRPEWRRRYERLFAEGALFLAEGTALAGRVAEVGGPADRIRVQHLGVDTERIPFRERVPVDGRPLRILMCGHFREKKGFAEGIEALGRAFDGRSDPGIRVRLVGAGPEAGRIEAAVAAAGLIDCVEFLGLKSYSVVLQEIMDSDLLLQPSRTAADGDAEGGAPVILLDAQAAGLPVVATTHADIPEYVRHGVTGWLAPEDDADGLVEALRQAVAEAGRWPAVGRAGRAHVEAEYDARTQARRLEAIYDEVAGSA